MSKKALATGHEDPDKEVNIGIIITPMLDMAFQLMAFFIMTYHPSSLEGHIDGKLLPPEKIISKGAASKPKEPDEKAISAEVDPAVKDAVLVIIKAVAPGQTEGKKTVKGKDGKIRVMPKIEGEPSRILVKTTESQEPELISDSNDDLEKGWKKLQDRLKAYQKSMDPIRAAQKGQKDKLKTIVKLMPDGNLEHVYVVTAWDICKGARFDIIGFVPPPDFQIKSDKLQP